MRTYPNGASSIRSVSEYACRAALEALYVAIPPPFPLEEIPKWRGKDTRTSKNIRHDRSQTSYLDDGPLGSNQQRSKLLTHPHHSEEIRLKGLSDFIHVDIERGDSVICRLYQIGCL